MPIAGLDDNRAAERLADLEAVAFAGTPAPPFSNTWAVNVLKQIGNYGEVYERNLGSLSPLKIPRGLNKLWSKGGLQYGPPIR
jgi:general L-amino acid transport system substrate-binding protein